MTPPPTTTTRARSGRAGAGAEWGRARSAGAGKAERGGGKSGAAASAIQSALRSALQGPVAADERVGRGVVAELGFGGALQLRDDRHRQRLAEFDAPPVERVDVPDGPLREYAVLVERDERTEGVRGQLLRQQDVGGPVPLHDPVRY